MKPHLQRFYCVCLSLIGGLCFGQDVSLWEQFNGRYDFTVVGNTLNTVSGNNINNLCTILSSSSESLNLLSTDTVEKAYIYWAGSGTGDFEIKINGTTVNSERNFAVFQNNLNYFAAFADVTNIVQTEGNGLFTISELDLQSFLSPTAYCNNRTNFGGWAILIIYKNDALPLNQVNVYDGLQAVSQAQPNLTLTLNSLNVIDNEGAKLGFIAWEGDADLANQETFTFNGNDLTNSQNPLNNAFNSTNSFTGSNQLFNMDLDVYDIQNFIQIGNPTAIIELTSLQDFVMITTVVSKLNNQLPDATVSIENVAVQCNSRQITVEYTVYNVNSTDVLPSGIPIGIYANDTYIEYDETVLPLPVGGSEIKTITVTIPAEIPNDFILTFRVDSDEQGNGTEIELNENNNDFSIPVTLLQSPAFNLLDNLEVCNEGFKKGTFDFYDYAEMVKTDPAQVVAFFENEADALANQNAILNTSDYVSDTTPREIFVRIDNEFCYSITSFLLTVKNCPPKVYNFVSANNDGNNDTFFVEGLRNIFVDFHLEIYNRWGNLIWTGDNGTEDWYGFSTHGTTLMGNKVTEGTYFYILNLNDPDYPQALTGFIHLTR